MPNSLLVASITCLLLSSNWALAVPASAKPPKFGEPYPGTCSTYTINFDELGDSAGHSRDLPKDGYNYKKMVFRSGEWGWVSKGLQQTSAVTADHEEWVYLDVTTRSGNNALADLNDDGSNELTYFDAGDVPSGKPCHGYYFDLRSFWVRSGSAAGPFTYRLSCKNNKLETVKAAFDVPALQRGRFYKVVLPKSFSKLFECKGGIAGTQAILDDIQVQMCELNTCK